MTSHSFEEAVKLFAIYFNFNLINPVTLEIIQVTLKVKKVIYFINKLAR